MKKLLPHIIGSMLVVVVVWFGVRHGDFWQAKTAFAVGDLLIDWNVPAGNPIFVVNNFAPGQLATRQVEVTNSAAVARDVGVRGAKTNELGALGDVLEITVLEGSTPLYGGTSATGVKTLNQFFADGASPNGIFLKTTAPSETIVLNFTVKFRESAGNPFQNAQVMFNITLGVTGAGTQVPSECVGITFAGAPIMGTEKSDRVRGTPGNDLIFGLEGSDAIEGQGGQDCIVGGVGNDSLRGESGNDVLFGNEGNDSLKGGNDQDLLLGGIGNDGLDGDNGNDEVRGGSGNDGLNGGNGDDMLVGEEGIDSAHGEAGVDTCIAETKKTCEI